MGLELNWQELTVDRLLALSVGTEFMIMSSVWTNSHKVRKTGTDEFRKLGPDGFTLPSTGFHPASNFETIRFAIVEN